MANATPILPASPDPLPAVRRALAEELNALTDVDAAYVSIEGSHVTVRAFVRDATLEIAERLFEVSERLDARFPNLLFEVIPRAHQGRGSRISSGGADPDYERPMT